MVEFDVKTVTAADYTTYFDLSDQLLEEFEQEAESWDEERRSEPKLFLFKKWLRKHIEQTLTVRPTVNNSEDIKIANITFAFYNKDLIALLDKRGYLFKTAQRDKF